MIGVGNEYRRDDAVGLLIARRLKDLAPDYVTVVEERGEGTRLMELWKNADTVILIDAISSTAKPGTICHLDAQTLQSFPAFSRDSTHSFGVGEAIDLSRRLGELPRHFTIYGVEARDFEAGETLTPDVEEAVQEVVEHVLQEISGHKSDPDSAWTPGRARH